MSVGFRWEPVSPSRQVLDHGMSSDADKLADVFGPSPWVFTREQQGIFRAMGVVSGPNTIYWDIHELLDRFETVRVWPEY